MTFPLMADNNTHSDILISLGVTMKGIRPKGKCPVPDCQSSFKWNKQRGYICPEHNTSPPRFLIDFNYKGERIRRGTTFDGQTLRTFADASALLRQAYNEIDAKTFDRTKWKSKARLEFQFSRLMDKWLDERDRASKQGKLAPGYINQLHSYVRCHFKPFFSDMDVREIRAGHIKDFINQLTLSLKSQSTMLNVLKAFFGWLRYSEEAIEKTPHYPTIEVSEREVTVISRDIQLQLLELIEERHRPIFTYLFYQGCRPSEARALKWKDIEDDIVTYRRTWSQSTLKEHTKKKRIRKNYLFPETQAALPLRSFSDMFVFTHGRDIKRHYSHDYLNDIFRAALGKLNEIRASEDLQELDVTLYEATKHSFGTNHYQEGVPLDTLQAHFGHQKRETTLIYTKLDPVEAFRKITAIGDRSVTRKSHVSN